MRCEYYVRRQIEVGHAYRMAGERAKVIRHVVYFAFGAVLLLLIGGAVTAAWVFA
jgi:hypothetical protein